MSIQPDIESGRWEFQLEFIGLLTAPDVKERPSRVAHFNELGMREYDTMLFAAELLMRLSASPSMADEALLEPSMLNRMRTMNPFTSPEFRKLVGRVSKAMEAEHVLVTMMMNGSLLGVEPKVLQMLCDKIGAEKGETPRQTEGLYMKLNRVLA